MTFLYAKTMIMLFVLSFASLDNIKHTASIRMTYRIDTLLLCYSVIIINETTTTLAGRKILLELCVRKIASRSFCCGNSVKTMQQWVFVQIVAAGSGSGSRKRCVFARYPIGIDLHSFSIACGVEWSRKSVEWIDIFAVRRRRRRVKCFCVCAIVYCVCVCVYVCKGVVVVF